MNADGTLTIKPGCDGQICVSVGTADHAVYFITNKRPDGTVVVFEVDRATHDRIMADAVDQDVGRQYPGQMQVVDEGTSGTSKSLQLPQFYEQLMIDNASNARILTQEEFLNEFGP